MRNFTFLPLVALALVACADAGNDPVSPETPAAGAPAARIIGVSASSTVISQQTVADTVITVFRVGTDVEKGASFSIGHSSRIAFPYSTNSICDPRTSGYGPLFWTLPCAAATTPIEITAKAWVNERGKLETDFQPALRFVPTVVKTVTVYLRDPALSGGTKILFCETRTKCVDEAVLDPTLATKLDAANGFAYRTIRHFSGYTVIAD